MWAISSNSIFRLSNKITLYLRVSKQNISLCSKKSPLQPQIFQAIMSISQNGVSQRSNTALHHIPQILRFCQYYQKVKHLCMYVIFYKYSANPACVKKILLYFLLGAINRIKNTNSTLQFIHILLTSFKKGQFYELRISADIRFYCQKRQLTVQPFCCGFRTNLITDTQRKPDTHIRKIKNK